MSYELGKTKKQPFCSKSSWGLSNSIFVKTCSNLYKSNGSNEPRGSFAGRLRDSENAEKSDNLNSNFNIYNSKERCRTWYCNKFKEVKQTYTIQAL